jgi:hypothetical protein
MNKNKSNRIVLYTNKNGKIEFRADTERDTLWASQDQISRLFETERSVVTKHINNIFKDDEVGQKSNVQKMHITNSDKPITLYSLDIILAVGYRTNSKKAIKFRKWATRILRQYLIKGFNLDRQKLITSKENFGDLRTAIDFIESKSDKPLKAKIRLSLSKDLI